MWRWEIPHDTPAGLLALLERCRNDAYGVSYDNDDGEKIAYLLSALVGIGAILQAGTLDGWELCSLDEAREHFQGNAMGKERLIRFVNSLGPDETDFLIDHFIDVLKARKARLAQMDSEIPAPDLIAST